MALTMKLCSLALFVLLVQNPAPCEASPRRLLGLSGVATEVVGDVITVVRDTVIKIHPTATGSSPPQQFDPSLLTIPSLVTSNNNGISYHGGQVMTAASIKTYVIFYGNWAGNNATSIVTRFLSTIGGTPYFNINKLYTDNTGKAPSGQVSFDSSIQAGYPYGTNISDAQLIQVVANALSAKTLPVDTDGVYFVCTSSDVNEYIDSTSAFCSAYCGYHSSFTYGTGGPNIKYSFIGNTDRCPSACTGKPGNAPNGNAGGDGMTSIIAHELEETATDEHGDAWYDSQGEENADKCAYNYGTTYTTANGQTANVKFGGIDYLIQQNWKPANGGACALS